MCENGFDIYPHSNLPCFQIYEVAVDFSWSAENTIGLVWKIHAILIVANLKIKPLQMD